MFGEIHSSLCVRCYVCDAVVYDLQELECPLNPKNSYYIRKKLCKHTLSPQPTINIVKCLQLMLCCCIFLPSLSISVCCHKKNKIWGKAASSVLKLYIYIYPPKARHRPKGKKIEQSVKLCHTIMRHCSNFCEARILLKPDKSELISFRSFKLPLKLSKTLIRR